MNLDHESFVKGIAVGMAMRRWASEPGGAAPPPVPEGFRFTVEGSAVSFNVGGQISVDWGDGAVSNYNVEQGQYGQAAHTYDLDGTHIITIGGNLTGMSFSDNKTIREILSPLPASMDGKSLALTFCNSTLEAIPADLFVRCPGIYDFQLTFLGTKLTEIPEGLFDPIEQISDIHNCFYDCQELTGEAPALWETFQSADGAGCFHGCTGLSNYADIPSGWK